MLLLRANVRHSTVSLLKILHNFTTSIKLRNEWKLSLNRKQRALGLKSTVPPFPALQAHFTSVTFVARVMTVFGIVVRHAVHAAVRPIP